MKISGQIILKPGKEQAAKRFHPWIFSGAVQSASDNLADGGWVRVADHKDRTLGFGHWQKGSITVRMLSFGESAPDENFWTKKIHQAVDLRKAAGLPSATTNAFRLVHGEADGLPGLIVDFYNGIVVMQAHSVGMHNDRYNLSQALHNALQKQLTAIYYKSKSTLPEKFKAEQPDGYLSGMGIVPHLVYEHGVKFFVDWETGQKTGFFLDQRENRKLVADFSTGKNVLNTFCYTGGFSVYALQAGASLVHSVDASEKAIDITRKNIELNGFDAAKHACFALDTFEFLKGKENHYDLIVLDPPAFAKHRDARHQAVKGYQRLNVEAIKAVKSGGIIFTFSCSQVVDKQLFYDTVTSAAIQAGREVKVLHRLSQPADHPVSMYHPEGEYLKGLVLYVV